jgi:nucleotide-binding universal stress UspA family protein
VDFSPGSQQAIQLAVRLASSCDAEIVIAHAWYIPPVAGAANHAFPANLVQQIADDANRALEEASTKTRQLGAKRVRTLLLTGMPWHQIVDVLADHTYDLVVMGTHGRTGLARVLLGSVAEKVVRHAPCSVLTTKPNETRSFSHVLCPIDFSESSRYATELAATLVQPGGSGITLLHVVETPVVYAGEPEALEFLTGLDRRSMTALEDWASQLRSKLPAAIPVVTKTRIGNPGAQTLEVLDDGRYDLCVTGTHGRTGLRRALLGSVAEKLVRHASCPVLVARRHEVGD